MGMVHEIHILIDMPNLQKHRMLNLRNIFDEIKHNFKHYIIEAFLYSTLTEYR